MKSNKIQLFKKKTKQFFSIISIQIWSWS